MAPIAGWYDDPRDQHRLRYWDGDAWTEHVMGRREAAAAAQQPPQQATEPPSHGPTQPPTHPPTPPPTQQPAPEQAAGSPAQPSPAAPQWNYPGAPPAQQQSWNYGTSSPRPWQPMPTTATGAPLTNDGVAITSWGKRLAARVLDFLVVAIGGLPFTGYFLYRTVQAVSDQLGGQTRISFVPTADVVKWESALFAMFLVVYACYEMFCLQHWSATAGKRMLEISVRRSGSGGKLDLPTILRRMAFTYGVWVLLLVPVLSFPAAVLALLDYLWPLWDKRRQALHDKLADTVVVEGAARPS